jgi:hypothetical protein
LSTTTSSAVEPSALASVTHLGVTLLAPPFHRERRVDLLARDIPCITLLEEHELPPDEWSPLEDWVRLPVDSVELVARAETLSRRARAARASFGLEDGVLEFGEERVILSVLESRLVGALVGSLGRVVDRPTLVEAAWPEGPPGDSRALDCRIKLLRRRLASHPLDIHTIRGRGYLAQVTC